VNEAIRGFVAALAELEPYDYPQGPAPPGMVYIPPGPSFFGEGPDLRIVQLGQGVCIDHTPVSVGEYMEFVSWVTRSGRKGHQHCHPNEPRKKNHHPDAPGGQLPTDYLVNPMYRDFPIVEIDWFDAHALAAWKGKRLPTEEEWEKAARGPFGRLYPWGERFDRALANSAEHWADKELPDYDAWKSWWDSSVVRKAMPTMPGEFAGCSPYGCIDMAGNVWEWTASLYRNDEGSRVVRGGAFNDSAQFLRAAFRYGVGRPDSRNNNIGFRCAQDRGSGSPSRSPLAGIRSSTDERSAPCRVQIRIPCRACSARAWPNSGGTPAGGSRPAPNPPAGWGVRWRIHVRTTAFSWLHHATFPRNGASLVR
jgi:sulfatase modifying factor 1